MNLFAWIWLSLFSSGLILEIIMVVFRIKRGTLTWNVRHHITGLYSPRFPRWLAITNRVLLIGFTIWFNGHVALGWGP